MGAASTAFTVFKILRILVLQVASLTTPQGETPDIHVQEGASGGASLAASSLTSQVRTRGPLALLGAITSHAGRWFPSHTAPLGTKNAEHP